MFNVKKVKALHKKSRHDPMKLALLSEKLLSGLTEEVSSHAAVECGRGCAHCCYLRVDAYDFESDSIVHYIETRLSNPMRILVKTAIEEQYEIIREMTAEQHYRTNVKCPLLVNNVCSVYTVRPVSCAAYHSLSESACQRSYDDPNDDSFPIPQKPNIEYMKIAMHNFIQEGLGEEPPTEMVSQLYLKLHV
jgi:Fe-S-cluster containining protein